MNDRRAALITGITGQDGSYLAELLLDKGYEVHGMVRRASTEKFERIEHIRERVTLHQGDLLDHRSLVDALKISRPTEIYNLAAMSFVAVSWIQPTLTAEFTGVGVTRMLEAMREVCPDARFYQASSSEMFGKVREVPQNETTPFYPRSPYGVAKAYGHFITVNYRESYDLHATSGILFNHESLCERTPLLVRDDGVIDVRTPLEIVPVLNEGGSAQTFTPLGLLEVWDGTTWSRVHAVTATRRRHRDPDQRPVRVHAHAGVVDVTAHHNMLDSDFSKLRACELAPGDQLALCQQMPEPGGWTVLTEQLAELLGLLSADGYVSASGTAACFVNDDLGLRAQVAGLWSSLFLGRATEQMCSSGPPPGGQAARVHFRGAPQAGPWLREQLYTPTGFKRVPPLILNSSAEVQQAFLRGYRACAGLESKDGESVKTNSAVLAQGLCWMCHASGQPASVHAEQRGSSSHYRLDLFSRARAGGKARQLCSSPAEVCCVVEAHVPDEQWTFDIETDSGRFCAGVGRLVISNSPRRGLEFVTRKITWHAAAIKLGLAAELRLGNLDAERDWGYAKDYVEAMWLMLQRDAAEDYVIATGEAHSVRECCQIAFDEAGLGDWQRHVVIDPAFVRPAEVDHLIGDASKAARDLDWQSKTSFEEMIRLMTRADLQLLRSR